MEATRQIAGNAFAAHIGMYAKCYQQLFPFLQELESACQSTNKHNNKLLPVTCRTSLLTKIPYHPLIFSRALFYLNPFLI